MIRKIEEMEKRIGILEDIEQIVGANPGDVPVLVRDIAEVRFGSANRFGAITANGEGEKVMGQIMMLKDANSNKVIKAVKERVEEVQEILPKVNMKSWISIRHGRDLSGFLKSA